MSTRTKALRAAPPATGVITATIGAYATLAAAAPVDNRPVKASTAEAPAGMGRMHELTVSDNPGMERMHES